jgi:hypothetical protein
MKILACLKVQKTTVKDNRCLDFGTGFLPFFSLNIFSTVLIIKIISFASGPQEDRLVTRARELVCGPLKQKWAETLREAANQLYQVYK